jgi:hypothetical protein
VTIEAQWTSLAIRYQRHIPANNLDGGWVFPDRHVICFVWKFVKSSTFQIPLAVPVSLVNAGTLNCAPIGILDIESMSRHRYSAWLCLARFVASSRQASIVDSHQKSISFILTRIFGLFSNALTFRSVLVISAIGEFDTKSAIAF